MTDYTKLRPPQTPYNGTPCVAFVLGGSGAIGSAVCAAFASMPNWRVCAVARNIEGLDRLDERVLRITADAFDYEQLAKAVMECTKTLGTMTVAICAAGEFTGSKGVSAIPKKPKALCAIEMNFAALVAPVLRANRQGAVLFTTSSWVHTLVDYPGFTEHLAWANGVSGIYEGLFTEFRQLGIRVSMLSLGLVRGSKFSRAMNDAVGMGRNPALTEDKWVSPEAIARAVQLMTLPEALNGNMIEMELTPQLMANRNQVFTEGKKIEELVTSLTKPTFKDAKVAFVTGAGKGIGRGVALEFAKAGYHIVGVTRTAKDLESLEAECKHVNPSIRFLGITLDVTNEQGLEDAVQKAVEHFGTLTVVVSNAGTNRRRPAALSGMKVWNEVMNVDLLAAMNLTRLSLPWLLRHARLSQNKAVKPTMSFVSTGYAHPKGVRMPGLSPYISSKAATNAFAAVVLEEVRDFGVGVTCFCPGSVATDLGLKPNQASKGGRLIEPEYLIQAKDCGVAILFAVEGCDQNTCCGLSNLETLYHGYPAIRNSQAKWLAGGSAKL